MATRQLAEALGSRPGLALVLGLLALASVLLYLPTIDYGFVWDDATLIAENQLLARSQPWDLFGQSFWAGAKEPPGGTAQAFYRPLTNLSFWLDLKLAGLNPGYFHLINVVLNALVTVMVGLIIWELLHSGIWAGLGGLLFTVHSSHVESASFISGRTDLLLALFVCVASFALLRSLRKRNRNWWPLIPIAFGLALLSKETAIFFPVLVALAPLLTQTSYERRYWLLVASTVVVAVVYLLMRNAVVGAMVPALPLGSAFSRFVEVANTFGFYIKMFLWPFAHQVKFPHDPSFANLTPNALVALLFIVTLPLLAIRRRFSVALLGYAWTILFLLPVSNIVQIGPQAAERLLYLPSVGLVLAGIALLSRLLHTRPLLSRIAAFALVAASLVLGIDTLVRSRVWRDELTLYSTMANESPSAPSAHANLANAVRFTHPDSAINLYKKAILLDQGQARAHINIGILYSQQGDHRQALHHLRIANELRPGSGQVLNNIGLAFLGAKEPESALAYLEPAIAVEPKSAPTRLNHALALRAAGRSSEAEVELLHSLELDPKLIQARLLRAEWLEGRGVLDSAVLELQRVTKLDSCQPALWNRIGTLLVKLGDSAQAERCYAQAVGLDSVLVPALFNLAILLSTKGDTARAIPLARRAHNLRPDLASVEELYLKLTSAR